MTADDPRAAPPPMLVTPGGVLRGMREMLPFAFFALPFGLAFGAAATERGLAPELATVMSLLVFAGAAQFAALELWVAPLPLGALALVVLAVNARHLLLGAALAPWLLPVPPGQRHLVLAFLSDANWAHSRKAFQRGARDAGLLLGGGLVMWAFWVGGTAAGGLLGGGLGDMKRLGLDLLMPAFFMTMLVGQWQGRADLPPWAVAGAVALVGVWLLPPGWHVVAGGLAGGLAGLLLEGRGRAD